MTSDGESAGAAQTADALRLLAHTLRHVDDAAAAVEWHDTGTLAVLADHARAELAARDLSRHSDPAIDSVHTARAAVWTAISAVAHRHGVTEPDLREKSLRRSAVARLATPVPALGRRTVTEIRHILVGRPRAVLVRLAITLAISLSLVTAYHLIGWASYDNAAQLALYLFAAVVGSVVCTNALCFDAERVRHALAQGEPLWHILVAKNLGMAVLVLLAGLPVIAVLTFTADVNPVSMTDQLLTMVFIWLGVANVLSVVYPLRHEPISARVHDGTWQPFLLSFAISYGVGLTVNLMIYWRLWARQTAATELVGGVWTAFILVLVSSMVTWLLLTVLAVACSRDPQIRRLLVREMVVYRKKDAGGNGL